MNKRSLRLTLSAVLLAFLCVLALQASYTQANALKLIGVRILHTQEHHGQATPINGGSPALDLGGFSARRPIIDKQRAEGEGQGLAVLTLDSGDLLVGTPLSSAFKGEPDILAMNEIKYDAMSPGNHEFDFELKEQRYKTLAGLAKFPFLAANLKGSDKLGITPNAGFIIKDFGEFKVGIIGITNPITPEISSPPAGVTFDDPVATVNAVLTAQKANADIWIALTHEDSFRDVALLKGAPGLDAVIGGHTFGFKGVVTRETFKDPINDDTVPDAIKDQPTEVNNPNGVYVRAGEGAFFGRLGTAVGQVDLFYDVSTKKISRAVATNIPVVPASKFNAALFKLSATNATGQAVSGVKFTLAGANASGPLVLTNPSGCPAPKFGGKDNVVEVTWASACVANGASVSIRVSTSAKPTGATAQFTDGGKDIGSAAAASADAAVATTALDPKIEAILKPFVDDLSNRLKEVVGKTTVELEGRREIVRQKETNLGNLLADVARESQKTDIGFQNSGGIRTSIKAGDITIADVLAVNPFGNTIVKFNLKGADLFASLENGVSQIEAGAGRFPQISGMCFSFDKSKPAGQRVLKAFVGNKPLDPNATYSIATNNFTAGGGDGYVLFANNRTNYRDSQFVDADVFADYLRAKGTVSPKVEGRITEGGAKTACE
ncbi:5'-nucleotidase C-terminal domain-containing protein [Candidatus Acetothermia bacterium]|nr:5'-nucleotidase C-terminal domain-containing protein [Candidatus Acetothermia bacterium]